MPFESLKTTSATYDPGTGSLTAPGSGGGPVAVDAPANVILGNRAGRTIAPATTTNIRNVSLGGRSLEQGGLAGGPGAGLSRDNVTAGFQAMGTTTGVGNVALGFSVLGGAEAANGPADATTYPSNAMYNVGIGYEVMIYGYDLSGNVAIGQNAATEMRHGAGIVAIGTRALRAANAVNKHNIAIGLSAMDNSVAPGTASRGHNIAIGVQAMMDATGTDLTDNVAIGANAGQKLTARSNVFIGRAAGQLQTSAIENVAVGAFALNQNTTGTTLAALGTDALRYNTTGTNNVAVGPQAGRDNTTGGSNTAIGSQALKSGNGTQNTALGYAALIAATAGNSNTAIGANALGASTTAATNTAVGSGAGGQVTTGGVNTFVGVSSGNGLTTGTANVFVGHNTQAGAAQVNVVVIGHSAAVTANEATAIGQGATVGHANSVALGRSSSTTQTNQVMIGGRDLEITDTVKGVVQKSPDGTRYRIQIANGGAVSAVAA